MLLLKQFNKLLPEIFAECLFDFLNKIDWFEPEWGVWSKEGETN